MPLNDLKELWSQYDRDVPAYRKDGAEIRRMLGRQATGVAGKVRSRVLLETLVYALMVYAFIDLFDAFSHPWYVNAFGFGIIGLGIVNNVILYRLTGARTAGEDLRQYLEQSIGRLKRQLRLRSVFFAFFMLAIALLLTADYGKLFASAKGLLFVGVMAAAAGVKIAVENQVWQKYIRSLTECLQELNEQ